MSAAKRNSIADRGLDFMRDMERSPWMEHVLYLLRQKEKESASLPTVAFANVPMYAQWFRRDYMAWAAICNIDCIGTTFNPTEYQEYYDQVLTANASSGENRVYKFCYDALYREGESITNVAAVIGVMDIIYKVVGDYIREGGNMHTWLRNASAPESKLVTAAIAAGAIKDAHAEWHVTK